MQKIFLGIVVFALLHSSAFSQIETSAPYNYYPLSIGNKWQYHSILFNYLGDTVQVRERLKEVVGDTIMPNGKRYFAILIDSISTIYCRMDTLTSKVFEFQKYRSQTCTDNEVNVFDLSIKDSVDWKNCTNRTYNISTSDITAKAGNTDFYTRQKIYECDYPYSIQILSFGIGISYQLSYEVGYTSIETLNYACINGKEYGVLTGIKDSKNSEPQKLNLSNRPNSFQLFQNYPNPFNQITAITIKLRASQQIRIDIFDINGRFIKEIINTKLKPGAYTFFWNGTSEKGRQVSSGIYYYRLQAGKYVNVKRMVLLR